MIKVENLFHDYEGKKQYAVNDVSFNIEKGEIFGFLGPNGAGKSTVQNIMTGILKKQQGQVLYNNKPIEKMGKSFNNRIGVSFEQPNIYLKLTGYENLKYFGGLFNVKTEDPMKLLERVGLKDEANKRTINYSKGMKQRLGFIRSIINNPEILFLDEPLAGLDPNTASGIKEIIKDMKKKGVTVFLTTHNMFVADELCDRVAFINEGKIIAEDNPRNLKLKYGKQSVKIEAGKGDDFQTDVLFLENEEDKEKFDRIMKEKHIQTIHSQEATLEQIFIKLTGRGLV